MDIWEYSQLRSNPEPVQRLCTQDYGNGESLMTGSEVLRVIERERMFRE
jgi:hypothetical protein